MRSLKTALSGVGWLYVGLLVGFISLIGVGTEAAGSDYVWCYFEADDNWKEPPFEDVLLILDRDGTVVSQFAQFNGIGDWGGKQPIAALADGQSAILSEQIAGRIMRIAASGEVFWSFDYEAFSVGVLPGGLAYVLSTGTIRGKNILLVDIADGTILKEAEYGGIHLAVDELNHAIWIVGDNIKKLSLNLELEFVIDPIEWAAMFVDTASDGSAWVGEAKHSQVEDSGRVLLKISPDGELLQTIELIGSPYSISVDTRDDSVWIGTTSNLMKFDENGNELLIISGLTYSVCVDLSDGSVWAAHPNGIIAHYSASGEELLSVETGIQGYCWISLPKQ